MLMLTPAVRNSAKKATYHGAHKRRGCRPHNGCRLQQLLISRGFHRRFHEPQMAPETGGHSRSSWQVLSQRDFRSYFLGSLISNLGTWLQGTAQVLIAYQVTRSVFMVGLIASAQFAGMVASPWAPVLADRFSPRAVLVW